MEEKILVAVVDDDKMSLKIAKRVLDRAGIAGVYLGTGEELFSWLGSIQDGSAEGGSGTAGAVSPDLILLDVNMPDMDGFEVLDRLKKDPAHRNVPVIFLTGDEDVKTETEGLDAGAADFIRKPFAAEVLLKRVRNTVELNRLHNHMASEIKAKTEKLSRIYLQIEIGRAHV